MRFQQDTNGVLSPAPRSGEQDSFPQEQVSHQSRRFDRPELRSVLISEPPMRMQPLSLQGNGDWLIPDVRTLTTALFETSEPLAFKSSP